MRVQHLEVLEDLQRVTFSHAVLQTFIPEIQQNDPAHGNARRVHEQLLPTLPCKGEDKKPAYPGSYQFLVVRNHLLAHQTQLAFGEPSHSLFRFFSSHYVFF